ncbi:hypothetical protein FKW77_007869 [Venturia effusa]|uniref:Uncharacterized protein n=1 Tax=Venturia effusa TaxID=50376 RepID=A0A517LB99_9PEZI|nr:hypothetical protein FKW77_007869 [Venturia effusa]
MKWSKKSSTSPTEQLSNTSLGVVIPTNSPSNQFSDTSLNLVSPTASSQPQEQPEPRTHFSTYNTASNKNEFEIYLASLVLKSLLLPSDITYLRSNDQVWDRLSQLHGITKRFQSWEDGKTGKDDQGENEYMSRKLLEGAFEPIASSASLRAFADARAENRVLLHVVTAPLRKMCVGAVAKMRISGRAVFDRNGGLVVHPHIQQRGRLGIGTSSILKEAGLVTRAWLEKQDRESVAALVKDAKSLLEKVRR